MQETWVRGYAGALFVDACFFVAREVAQRSMIPNKSG